MFSYYQNRMSLKNILLFLVLILLILPSCNQNPTIISDLKQWHTITLTFSGPSVRENSTPNPFLDYKLSVEFTHSKSGEKYFVPGFYAADGNAANSGATEGDKWKVKFNPNKSGQWLYEVHFLKGKNIAVKNNKKAKSIAFDGNQGSFIVKKSDSTNNPFVKRGRLQYTEKGYLQFAETKEYFLKAGANSPENFLAYQDFDGTYFGGENIQEEGESAPKPNLHSYSPHKKDWNKGDPTWQKGEGKEIIGAVNYLAEQGMNSIYFLTMNIEGDGDDVWPYTRRNERYRFDCSKLAQWNIVLSHMNNRGIIPHIVLQETENECLLDAGYPGVQRKLYLRELVARFSHLSGLIWNLGEEHGPVEWSPYGQTSEDTKKMTKYLRQIDPYNNPIVVHTHSTNPDRTKLIKPYLGFKHLDGISLQCAHPNEVNNVVQKWTKLSQDSSKKWLVTMDEIGPYQEGVVPDSINHTHDTLRSKVLWGSLMAGAAGLEWYFGYKHPNSDLTCENWRTRETMWQQTETALTFFEKYLPYWNMKSANDLVSNKQAYCFAKEGKIYAVYLHNGGDTQLKLKNAKKYDIKWFNPRSGGKLISSRKSILKGPGWKNIGQPPQDRNKDWVVLIRIK